MVDFRFSRRHLAFAAGLAVMLIFILVYLPRETVTALLRGFFAQRLLVTLLLLFCLVTLSLLWSVGQRLDTWIFLFFNIRGNRPAWLDFAMIGVTQVGNGVLAFALAGFFYLSGLRRLALLTILGVLTLWLVVETVKALTIRARPFISLSNTRVLGWKERGMSFPSGHTAQTFFLAAFFSHAFQFSPWWTTGLYIVAVFVGFTRVYVGVHYPRDVVAGAILGSVWGIIAILTDPYLIGALG